MYNGRTQTISSFTVSGSACGNYDIWSSWGTNACDNYPLRAEHVVRPKPPPPHAVATVAAMRDKARRAQRRPRSEARRPVALERRTWTAAPRRVL